MLERFCDLRERLVRKVADLSEVSGDDRQRLASELVAPTAALVEFEESFEDSLESPVESCVEAQSSILVARRASIEAVFSAYTLNRVKKISEGKSTQGKFTTAAQGAMRSALLFAGAGLDRTLKQLVEDTLPGLVEAEAAVFERLQKFAESHLSSKDAAGIDPKSLVKILLSQGQTPKEIIIKTWQDDLTASSAQSAQRVSDIASALGVVDDSIRRRISPSNRRDKPLERAFIARNEIAHELDMVAPKSGARERFERRQTERTVEEVKTFVRELVDVGQLIVNDVSQRLKEAPPPRGVTWADLQRGRW